MCNGKRLILAASLSTTLTPLPPGRFLAESPRAIVWPLPGVRRAGGLASHVDRLNILHQWTERPGGGLQQYQHHLISVNLGALCRAPEPHVCLCVR